jgi:hypothetical protein
VKEYSVLFSLSISKSIGYLLENRAGLTDSLCVRVWCGESASPSLSFVSRI